MFFFNCSQERAEMNYNIYFEFILAPMENPLILEVLVCYIFMSKNQVVSLSNFAGLDPKGKS